MSTTSSESRPSSSHASHNFSRGEANDYTYPVHILDGAKYQHCILTLFMRFNDVLDAKKIRDSLEELLEIGDWKKLAGRFRTIHGEESHDSPGRNQDGTSRLQLTQPLEIHVPREFTTERPPLRFAHESWDSSIFDHALGRLLPQATGDRVALSPPLDKIRLCGHATGFPLVMADLVNKDAPQLCFKVVSFDDATVLAITFSHCTWDISGLQGFLKSLELVLDECQDEVPPMLGARSDVLLDLASEHRSSVLDLALLNMGGLQKPQPHPPKPDMQERMIRVPLNAFQNLRRRIADQAGTADDQEALLYRHDELFLALIVQQIARALPVPQTVNLLNIFNLRLLVPQIASAEGIYSQNLVIPAPQRLSIKDATGPVGPIALAQRECFSRTAVPQHVTSSIYTLLEAIKADLDITALTNCGDEASVLVNNLIRASNSIDLNLSQAVVRQGDTSSTRRNGLGTADLCCLILPGESYNMMRVTALGNYSGDACWMIGELPARAWELIYKALSELE